MEKTATSAVQDRVLPPCTGVPRGCDAACAMQVLASKLLGPHWRLQPNPAVGDMSTRRMLTLADYRRRQGIA